MLRKSSLCITVFSCLQEIFYRKQASVTLDLRRTGHRTKNRTQCIAGADVVKISCSYRVKGFARECRPTALAKATKPLMPQNPIKPAAMLRLGMTPTVNPSLSTWTIPSYQYPLAFVDQERPVMKLAGTSLDGRCSPLTIKLKTKPIAADSTIDLQRQ